MRSVSVDVAEVEAEMRVLRSRLNALTLQRTAAIGVSTVIACGTTLIVLAVEASAFTFAVATWSAVFVSLSAVAYAGWRLHRSWLTLEAVASFADRRSGLQGRLTTAIADPAPQSRLRVLLIEQLQSASPLWRAATLAPQRIARSLLLVPLALAVLFASIFYARSPAPMTRTPFPLQASPLPLRVASAADMMPPAGADPAGAALQPASADGETSTRRATQGDSSQGSGRSDADGGSAGGDLSNAPGASSSGSGLRNAIRQALGADAERGGAAGTASDPGGGVSDSGADTPHDPTASDTAPQPNSAAGGLTQTAATDPSQTGQRADAQTGDGRGGAGHGSAGSSQSELFEAAAPTGNAPAGAAAKPMAIKLGAFSAAAPQQVEPQHRPSSPTLVSESSDGRHARLADLSAEQRPDAALQKLDVAPEHEAFVRRIFTRE